MLLRFYSLFTTSLLAWSSASFASSGIDIVDFTARGDCSVTDVRLIPQIDNEDKFDILVNAVELKSQVMGPRASFGCSLDINLNPPLDRRVGSLKSQLSYLHSFDSAALFRMTSSLRLYLDQKARKTDIWRSQEAVSAVGFKHFDTQVELPSESEIVCGAPASLRLDYKASITGPADSNSHLALFILKMTYEDAEWYKMGELSLQSCPPPELAPEEGNEKETDEVEPAKTDSEVTREKVAL